MEISFTKGKTGTLFLELLLPLLVFSGLQLKIKLAYFVEAYSGTFQSYMTTLLGDNCEKQLKRSRLSFEKRRIGIWRKCSSLFHSLVRIAERKM